MPTKIGQWTGLAVTTVVVLGADTGIAYAIPLGIMAGALASFLVALTELRPQPVKIKRR